MRQPDLNLLIYLDLLIKHGSVTRVAQEMGVSQPGVSAALRRLRAVLQDPVLVRTGGGRGFCGGMDDCLETDASRRGRLAAW